MKNKGFDYTSWDSQGTAVEPISMDSSDLWLKLVLKNYKLAKPITIIYE